MIKENFRRLSVAIRADQMNWLESLPYGMKQPLFQALIDDLIQACSVKNKDGTSAKFEVLGAFVNRTLTLRDLSPTISCSNFERENLKESTG